MSVKILNYPNSANVNSVSYTGLLGLVPWRCKLEELTTFYDHTNHLSCSRFRIKQHLIFFKRQNLWHIQKENLLCFYAAVLRSLSTFLRNHPGLSQQFKLQLRAASRWPPAGTPGGTGALLHWGWCSPLTEPARQETHTPHLYRNPSSGTGSPSPVTVTGTPQVTQLLLCLQKWAGVKSGPIRNDCCSPWQRQCGYDVFKKSPYVLQDDTH